MRNTIKHHLSLIFYLIASVATIGAQTYHALNFTSQDGLPSNNITSFLKSRSGFLWLGTDNGLVKWGNEFYNYSTAQGLASNNISAIAEDNNDVLWIGTFDNGLSKLVNGKFSNFTKTHGLSGNSINQLYYSVKKQLLLIGTNNGLTIYSDNKFISFESLSATWKITGFLENDSSVWICTENAGMHYFLASTSKIKPLSPNQRCYENTAFAWHVTKQNDTLISCPDNTIKIFSENKVASIKLNASITSFANGHGDKTWLIAKNNGNRTSSGLFYYQNGSIVEFGNNLSAPPYSFSIAIADETDGSMIFGCTQNGVFLWPGSTFEQIDLSGKIGTVNDFVFDADNKLWVLGHKFIVLTENNLVDEKLTNNLNYQIKNNDFISGAVVFKQSIFAIWNNKVVEINSGSGYIKPYLSNLTDSIINLSIINNHLLITTPLKLHIIDIETKKVIQSHKLDFPIEKIISGIDYTWILNTNQKLYLLNNNTLELDNAHLHWPNFPNVITHIADYNKSKLIILDEKGNFWIINNGKKNNQPVFVQNNQNLTIGSKTTWLYCDKTQRLWIGTNKGLGMIDLSENTAQTGLILWGKGEGYTTSESTKAIEANDGSIWIMSKTKLTHFSPNNVISIHRKPHLILSSITISTNSKNHHFYNVENDGMLAISPKFAADHNSLLFEFYVSNLLNKDKTIYQYRLMPGNKEWSAPLKQPFVFLSDLQPGKYTLGIKTWFQHAPTSSTETEYEFTIKKPWYLTIYAYVIYASILIVILIVIFEIRLKQIKKRDQFKNSVNEKIALLKMEALQAQMNPHFIFNALNTLQYNILENNTEKALEFLGEFSTLIRATLDNASQHFISLKDELLYIESYMKVEQMRYSQKFYYSISVAEGIEKDKLYIPPMIIQPHVENAIKYAFASSIGYIIISISKVENKLICIVEDNGIGRKQSLMRKKTHKSKGQSITSQRFDILNKFYQTINEYRYEIEDLYDEENNAAGTRITLYFPIISKKDLINPLSLD